MERMVYGINGNLTTTLSDIHTINVTIQAQPQRRIHIISTSAHLANLNHVAVEYYNSLVVVVGHVYVAMATVSGDVGGPVERLIIFSIVGRVPDKRSDHSLSVGGHQADAMIGVGPLTVAHNQLTGGQLDSVTWMNDAFLEDDLPNEFTVRLELLESVNLLTDHQNIALPRSDRQTERLVEDREPALTVRRRCRSVDLDPVHDAVLAVGDVETAISRARRHVGGVNDPFHRETSSEVKCIGAVDLDLRGSHPEDIELAVNGRDAVRGSTDTASF